MTMNGFRVPRRRYVAFVRCALLAFTALVTNPFLGQSPAPPFLTGVPHDWSHHHLKFSKPANAADAARLEQDPRYWHQWYHRNATVQSPVPDINEYLSATLNPNAKKPKGGIWGESLSSAGTATVGPGNYPAKYSFASNTLNCGNATDPDYVVYNTSLPGSAATPAAETGTFATGTPTAGSYITIVNNTTSVTANFYVVTSGTSATGTITVSARPGTTGSLVVGGQAYTFASSCGSTAYCISRTSTSGTNHTWAENIEAAINATSSECGTASPCYGTGTSANTLVSAGTPTVSGSNYVVPLTAKSGTIPTDDFILSSGVSGVAVAGGTVFLAGSNPTTNAGNLAAAIQNYTTSLNAGLGLNASNNSSATVTASTTTDAPASSFSFTFSTSGTTDFTWTSGGLTGGSVSQASIVAFDNLYSTTCTGSVPRFTGPTTPAVRFRPRWCSPVPAPSSHSFTRRPVAEPAS